MNNIENCPKCGNVFVKAFRSVCDKCHKEVEVMFQTVYTYIRKKENRMASVVEITQATEVEGEYIYQFIREGRLKVNHFPNLSYPCSTCGTMIKEGKICAGCKKSINDGLKLEQTEKDVRDRNRQQENAKYRTYETLNDRLK
ncbi:TIGR03826 family flagellar region protein [Alkalihalobacillus sp. LMS39]|uniref:TIGR03826 family flagellar region protein n=1 Tax=Alkalihalobacillus sp. LMS39 TaxID=2924032 RepID=UPI001FB34847|nr:TIGR03826 family flagellar region protein [Alkalihalobacillus sp. LMS39]UOE93811.1 hypothetical protein MM271_21980 [Alkalihalobacillus sp. LMS39]